MTLFWRLHFPGRLLVHIRPETCWQGLRGQFAEPCQWQKTLSGLLDLVWSLVQPIISDSVSPSSFDKDDAVSRTEEGFYLLTAAVVDNTICRGLAQFDTKYQIYLYFYEVVFLVWNVFQPWECNLYSQLKNILKTFWHSSCNPGFHFLLPFHAQLMTPFVWQRW